MTGRKAFPSASPMMNTFGDPSKILNLPKKEKFDAFSFLFIISIILNLALSRDATMMLRGKHHRTKTKS